MDERQPIEATSPDDILTPPGGIREMYGNISVISRKNGARIVWSENQDELSLNTSLFPSEDQARTAAIRQVASHTGLTQAIRRDASVVLENNQKFPDATDPVLRWQGLAQLRKVDPDIADRLPQISQNQSYVAEFYSAIDHYLLTDHYPDTLSEPVRQAIASVPRSPNGSNAVNLIASGQHLRFDWENFTNFIKPITTKLAEDEKQTGKSKQFEYRPSQTADLSEDKEPIQEGDITVSVTPFYGGYYREQVCRYDSASRQIVKESGVKQTWDIDDPPEDESVWKTKRTYDGTIAPGQEVIVKLPYGSLPLSSTLHGGQPLQFMRDELGIIYIDPRSQSQTEASGKFAFDFVLAQNESNQLNTPPVEADYTPAGGQIDTETQNFIDELTSQTWMSDEQKSTEIDRYIRKNLRYPQDSSEISQIDSAYLPEGEGLWARIAQIQVVHCYWANIYADELAKRLGMASRVVTGPYVSGKDLRFNFAVVEARGMDKHAWRENWDSQTGVWKRHDATPAKAKDESDESQDEQTEPLDGDFGESEQEQPDLTTEEIEELYQKLSQQLDQNAPPPTKDELAARQFEQEKGVPYRSWHEFEVWVTRVNRTPVPAEMSIRGRPSTIYNEWRDLFDLLYRRREIPQEVYKGPVRQSEGEVLDDPVTAYVDLRSGDTDPSGYKKAHIKTHEKIEVSVFDDDMMLDVSGSMSGTPADEQRKMVLTDEYNIKNTNERLNHSQNRNKMTTPLTIHSRVATVGDWTTTVQESSDVVSERSILKLDGNLKAHNQSSQGLREGLKQYREALTPEVIQGIKRGELAKVLTIVSDGDVTDQPGCIEEIRQIREAGIIVQGLGFGSRAQAIKVVCHDPADPDAAVVVDDVREATLARHKLLVRNLAKL